MTATAKKIIYFHSVAIPDSQPSPDKLGLLNAGLIDFVCSLSSRLVELKIVAPRTKANAETEVLRAGNLQLNEVSPLPKLQYGRMATFALAGSRRTRQTLRDADATISVGMSGFGFVSGILASSLGVDHAYIIRGDRATTVSSSSRSRLNKGLALARFRLYRATILRHVRLGGATVWFQGDDQYSAWKEELPPEAHNRIHLLNAVLRPLPTPSQFEKVHDLVFLGRLTIEKGLIELFEALSELTPIPSLLVIGDGPDRAFLERKADELGVADRVEFVGFVGDLQEMVDRLVSARAFVLPSYTEGLPRSVLEAMQLGVPVVTTRVGGLPQLLEPTAAGLLVEPRDSEALRSAILKVLSSDTSAMIDEAQRISQRHTFEEAATRFLEGISRN